MFEKVKFRLLLFFIVIFPMISISHAFAMHINGTSYDGFARIEFDWQSSVDYKINEYDREIFITFSSIIDANPDILERKLPDYIKSVYLSADLKTVIIELINNFKIKHFSKGGLVYVDIIGNGDYDLNRIIKSINDGKNKKNLTDALLLVPTTPKRNIQEQSEQNEIQYRENAIIPEKTAPVTVVQTEKNNKKTEVKKKEPDVPSITLRGGKHDGYERVVFDWSVPVKYHVNELNDALEVRFTKRGKVSNPSALKRFPENLKSLTYKNIKNSFVAYVPLKEGSTYKATLSGNKLIVDIFYAADSTDTVIKNNEDIMPVVTADNTKQKPDIDISLKEDNSVKIELSSDIKDDQVKDVPVLSRPLVTEITIPAIPQEIYEKPSAKFSLREFSLPEADKRIAILTLPFSKNQKIAVFKRHGIWWIVFSEKVDINVEEFKKSINTKIIKDIHIMSGNDENYTVVRMIMDDNIDISARKDGSTWLLDIYDGKVTHGGINVEQQAGIYQGAAVHMQVRNASQPITLNDPEIGDTLKIVCLPSSEFGVAVTGFFPDFDLEETVVGIVVAIRDIDTGVFSTDFGVDVKKSSGLLLSVTDKDLRKAKDQEEKSAENSKINVLKLFDIGDLQLSAKDGYFEELFKIKKEIYSLDAKSRNKARLRLARFYLANYMVPEALGVLDIILLHDEALKENAMYATLQGVTNAVLNRYEKANEWFNIKALEDNKEALLWKSYLSVVQDDSIENLKKNYPVFKKDIGILRDYPTKIRNKLAIQGLKIAVSLIDEDMANDYIGVIVSNDIIGGQKAALLYYKGLMSALSGYFEQAFTLLDDASKANSLYYRALAIREKLKLEFKLNRIDHSEVLRRFEQLRYSWRGDKFEYDVMDDLVNIYLRNGQYGEALRVLKDMIGIFKDKEYNQNIKKRMENIFADLYLNGVADKLSPVKAIGIYNDFKEITPSGEKGNEMIRRLADRMVSVDLLDQASELLKNQIDHRLKGKDRSVVGARLALINIMNNKPEYAIKVLDETVEKDMSPELAEHRRLIEAKAYSASGKYDKAIDLIKDDPSEEAKLLRTEILWDAKKWDEVSEVLRSMIKKPVKGQPLSNGQPGIIIDWITALRLAGREKVLMRVRDNFGPYMKNTNFYDTFNLLTDVGDSSSAYADFADHIKSAEGFKMFMNSYIDKLKNDGLSEAIK